MACMAGKSNRQAIIEKEAYTIPQIKKACKAGTGCGGCVTPVGEVPKLLAHTLKKLGKATATGICAHFSYSRCPSVQKSAILLKTIGLIKDLEHTTVLDFWTSKE